MLMICASSVRALSCARGERRARDSDEIMSLKLLFTFVGTEINKK